MRGEPEIIPPAQTYDVLMDRDWNEVRMGVQTIALICPMCGALVAFGAPPQGITYKDSHARDHQFIGNLAAKEDTR